jgi:hypothetical protein
MQPKPTRQAPPAEPLEEALLVSLAYQILEIHANRNLRAFLEAIWGHMEQIGSIALSSVETMGSEEIHSIKVWDLQGHLLLPDLSLPFWKARFEQIRDTPAAVLEEDLDESDNDEERLELMNEYLRNQAVFKEMGLPDPKDESLFFQHKTRLSDVPLEYPIVYVEPMKPQQQERSVDE